MTTLAEKISKYETVKRGNCRDCGNPWWFSEEHSYVCTTCAKTSGRSTGDEYKPKPHRCDFYPCLACGALRSEEGAIK